MDLSRRSFLETGSKLGLALVFTGGSAAIAFGQKQSQVHAAGVFATTPNEALGDSLSKITRVMFADNVETRFTLSPESGKLADVTLIEVNDLNMNSRTNIGKTSGECFSVIFRGPQSLALRQDTYTVKHRVLGEFRLLLVPGGPDKQGSGRRYAALVNRTFS